MKELKMIANDNGVFEEYDDIYDLTIHCTSQEEQDEVLMKLNRIVCTDAISRQAAINVAVDAVDDWDGGCNKTREEYIRKALETIPPVTPAEKVGKWIPVSERLPEKYGEYMITWTTSYSMVGGHHGLFLGIAEYEILGEYDHENNRFKGEWLLEDYVKTYPDVKVIAWMPLPEPYKVEPQESEG